MPEPDNLINREPLEENFDTDPIKEAELKKESEKNFLKKIGKKNKEFLVKLDLLERERLAKHFNTLYTEAKPKHEELEDRLDEYDEIFRMERKEQIESDGDLPNYRTPLSASTLEVVHANIMNVFFTPADIMKVIPTEKGDIPKVQKLDTFGNWSVKNELNIFEQIDKLFHSSAKNGESPYIVHWIKDYGVDIKREVIPDPRDPSKPFIDPDTEEPLFQEIEETKLLYNGPRLEVFSRKDYIQPLSATMDKTPPWEMRKIRMTFDKYLRDQLQGKMYAKSIDDIKDWGSSGKDSNKVDYEGDSIPLGKWEKEFIEVYGRFRIRVIVTDREDDTEELKELEGEYIAIFDPESEVLCSLRKNKFPLKLRPIGIDYFIPDDEGRRTGMGIMEVMDSMQKAYDSLFNQYIFGTIQSNNPVIFFEPTGVQRDEPLKIRNGYMYPVANSASIKPFQFPPPNASLERMLELVRFWAQMLFGISDFQAGLESKIDPDAPAKKAEIVVAQGNQRLNMIVKRKNKTLKDIFKRWYLLYQANMPPNKMMRIAGSDKDTPWEFQPVNMTDFALKSIPDFELVGNILNSNKSFEANKAIAIYQLLIQNPLFSPQSQSGLQSLHAVTKWLIDKMDETGLASFLPPSQGDEVQTPEEENARFLQGDQGEPTPQEDDIQHINTHKDLLLDPTVPEDVKKNVVEHIKLHTNALRQKITQQQVMSQIAQANPQLAQQMQGGQGGQAGAGQAVPPQPAQTFAGGGGGI